MTDPLTIIHADSIAHMATMPECSIDAIVTDPPYGIGFMNAKWDVFSPEKVAHRRKIGTRKNTPVPDGYGVMASGVAVDYDNTADGRRRFQTWTETWARAALRVLRPGGYALVCGSPRSHHRSTSGLEDAGFLIRDCLTWLHGQGFPKSYDVGKKLPAWDGFGTSLKPAWEPIVLAQRPLDGTYCENLEAHGVGALNIDASRLSADGNTTFERRRGDRTREFYRMGTITGRKPNGEGRWPANVLLDEEAAAMLDEQSGELRPGERPAYRGPTMGYGGDRGTDGGERVVLDGGGASRFFYTAKADKGDRGKGNTHPTVKPVALMRWLVRLVTPPRWPRA